MGGARALSLEAGRIAPGCWADFVAINLRAPALAETPSERLPAAIAFGAGNEAIAGTYVGGSWRASGAA
jgi:cytosine/adenosine deaminase-related metal-dependent hydrolase